MTIRNSGGTALNETDDGVTRWRRVADRIRAGISDGSIGERLASEAELAEAYAVNRHTVRRAIQALAAEGLLRAERGRGTFVNAPMPKLVYPVGPRTRFSENVVAHGLKPGGQLIRAELMRADAGVAALLELPAGSPVHKLERLHVANGIPLSLTTSYFPADRFPGIVRAYAEFGSITRALQADGLDDYTRRETRISAERVHPSDAVHLAAAPDSIVLVSRAIDVDLQGWPVQAMRARFPADRMELTFLNADAQGA
jgi:GntR family transcriptional regulator, phosphonate transport system regulatory protein